MEREADLALPRPVQRRELGSISEGEGSDPPQKIGDFLRHARAALRRPQPSAMSTSSLGRARRVLVTQPGSSNEASLNPCVEGSANRDTEIKVMRDSRSDADLFMAEKSQGNLTSKADQADPSVTVQQEKVDCKKRKGDSEVSPDDTLPKSVSNVKNISCKNENMGLVGVRREFVHVFEPVPNESVAQEGGSVNRYANLNNDYKLSESHGAIGKETHVIPSQSDQSCKAMVSDASKKVAFSSSGDMIGGVYPVKASTGNTQCNSCATSCEKQRPMLSNNLLMPITEDRFEAMDTAASTCQSCAQRADKRMATDTGMENLSSYFSSLAFTENECTQNNQAEQSAFDNQNMKQEYAQIGMIGSEAAPEEIYMRGTGPLPKGNVGISDQKFMAFIGRETTNPFTVSSGVATATSLQCTSAAPLNSATYNASFSKDMNLKIERDPSKELDVRVKAISKQTKTPLNHSDSNVMPAPPLQPASEPLTTSTRAATSTQMSLSSVLLTSSAIQDQVPLQGQKHLKQEIVRPVNGSSDFVKCPKSDQDLVREKDVLDPRNAAVKNEIRPQPVETRTSSSNINPGPTGVGNPGKAVSSKEAISRKKQYDPDVFFKVNGKLYQRLGKIGSGGSSEVYKVISSECTIYALKRIKLKGRDYSTAYGFCQEIEYLNRLRGKNNIIQLIDYEVTDKRFLEEANNDPVNMKDGRISDDACIYMVLEYGEIDLAHMLSQKWKEVDMGNSNVQMDENWLRFYWQQILKAVNTIHEERIVHSDLKPANFLLVKGSLKLIDFGIAKAIQSDTTNIQRDSQVGTLNYMSPEAFMCNDQDSDGNTIKCGRPSDIWSLGCILYQMVYGRTPFAEYKTFWTKYKVITDRNHEITYGPVSNPWLVDLMKKCLSWDRNERWRIPQLLEHPFLAPPVPSPVPSSLEQHCKLLMQIAESYTAFPQVSLLCSQLKQLITRLSKGMTSSAAM